MLFLLFLLSINRVSFSDWIVLLRFVFLARVFLNLVIKGRVVDMAFANAFCVALSNHSYESIL